MEQNVPIYVFESGTRKIRFAPDADYWITGIEGGDGYDLQVAESQAFGQIGASQNSVSMGSRDITITGVILDNLDTNEILLTRTVRPLAEGRLYKTAGGTTWYLDGVVSRAPIVEDTQGQLPFQFKLHCFYPLWRTAENAVTPLICLNSTWFPTPISTDGTFAISESTDSAIVAAQNNGNMDAEITVQISAFGAASNLVIYNYNTQTFLHLMKDFAAGEKAVISTVSGQRGCRLYDANGMQSNGFRYMTIDSDWNMILSPGENLLGLTATSGRENLDVRVIAPKGVSSSGT